MTGGKVNCRLVLYITVTSNSAFRALAQGGSVTHRVRHTTNTPVRPLPESRVPSRVSPPPPSFHPQDPQLCCIPATSTRCARSGALADHHEKSILTSCQARFSSPLSMSSMCVLDSSTLEAPDKPPSFRSSAFLALFSASAEAGRLLHYIASTQNRSYAVPWNAPHARYLTALRSS